MKYLIKKERKAHNARNKYVKIIIQDLTVKEMSLQDTIWPGWPEIKYKTAHFWIFLERFFAFFEKGKC